MALFSWGKSSGSGGGTDTYDLGTIYALSLTPEDFIASDIFATYRKILTDTLERTHGLNDKQTQLLWDNCVASETSDGLVTLLVIAMVKKTELFLVYNAAVNVIRVATPTEQTKIRDDYKKQGKSTVGVFLSFKNYRKTDMLEIFAALEYSVLASLHKTVNISKAVQIKMHELRKSVSLADADIAKDQAILLAEHLKCGKDVLLDAQDSITTAAPDVSPTEKAIAFLDAKRAFYLDLPMSYISGLQTPGIGSTGEADMRAVERGLKQYFFTIVHPVLFAIFNVDTEFKSLDFRQMTSALEVLKTFSLEGDELLSGEAKRTIIRRLFELDEKAEEKALAEEAKEREATPDEEPEEEPEIPVERGAFPARR